MVWQSRIQNRHSEFHISLFVIQRAKPTTPRTKQVHSNSNRKNTFSDYEFSIFMPVLNFFHAHRVSAKELRSKSLNLFAIRHECRTEIRSARLAEESLSRLKVIARKSQIFVAIQNTFNIQILRLRN